MKLYFMPTLTDMREMLGDELYVNMIWMWREREQIARDAERRQRLATLIPERESKTWPTPVFERAEAREKRELPVPLPKTVPAFNAPVMRLPRCGEAIEVEDIAGFIERVREKPREAAAATRRRRR